MFKTYMREIIALYSVDDENFLFVMDDASIHRREVAELAEEHGCKVLFNAPYSPECNPIEMVFGIWKTRVGKMMKVDIADVLTNIARCFEETTPCEIRRCVQHFLGPVTRRVLSREDL